jgi:hypothetical protein
MATQPTVETFTPHVGSTFRLELPDGSLDLVLDEAAGVGVEEQPSGARPQFSLSFRGPPQPILPQRIYHLVHPGLGELDIFLVPIGAGAEGVTYEAVFA